MYKKTGQVKIANEIIFDNPVWLINSVQYDWTNKKCSIEIIFNDGDYIHRYEFLCEKTWVESDCINAILSLEQFAGSTII